MPKTSTPFRGLLIALTVSGLSVSGLVGCGSSSSDNPTGPSPTTSAVPTVITTGSWQVASLTERTEDKSSQFAGFVFTFSGSATSGTVTVTKDNSTITGTWRHSPAVTYYGSSSTESIVLSLGTASPFDRLTGTWNVRSNTSTSLSLENPEVSNDEHLVFVRR